MRIKAMRAMDSVAVPVPLFLYLLHEYHRFRVNRAPRDSRHPLGGTRLPSMLAARAAASYMYMLPQRSYPTEIPYTVYILTCIMVHAANPDTIQYSIEYCTCIPIVLVPKHVHGSAARLCIL